MGQDDASRSSGDGGQSIGGPGAPAEPDGVLPSASALAPSRASASVVAAATLPPDTQNSAVASRSAAGDVRDERTSAQRDRRGLGRRGIDADKGALEQT